jgi:tetratricopeptide (TPR) repeat protein
MFSVRLGRYDEARVACVRALALARRHGDYDSEGDALDVLGYLAHTLGRHTEAIDYYDQALILFRDRGDTVGEAFALGRLGEAFAAGGQRAEARAVWRRAVELFVEQHRAAEVDRVQRLLADLEQHAAPTVLGA